MLVHWINCLPEFIRARVTDRSSLQQVISNTAWLFTDNSLRMALGFFVGVWIARYLGPLQFGQYNYALALVTIFGVIGGLAMDANVVRDLVNDPRASREILGTATVLKLLGGLLAGALCFGTIIVLRPKDHLFHWLTGILAAAIVFQACETITLWFQSQLQSKYTVWAKNAVLIVMTLVKVLLILLNASLLAFAWTSLGETILAMLALIFAYQRSGQRITTWTVRLERAKSLLKEGWPLLISAISSMLYLRVDMVMLGEMYSEAAVGIYGAATRISEAWYFIPMAITASLQPVIIEARKRGEELFHSRLRSIYGLMSAISVCGAIIVTIFADQLVVSLFGEFYRDAGMVLAVHVWASIAVFLGVVSSQYLVIENLQRISMYRTSIGLGSNVVLNIVLIPKHGAVGAAIATLISYFIATFSMYFFVRSRHQSQMMLRSLNPLEWLALLKRAPMNKACKS